MARENPEDIMLRNAVANLDTSNPTNVILQDIMYNQMYNPNARFEAEQQKSNIWKNRFGFGSQDILEDENLENLFEETYDGEPITKTDKDKESTNLSSDFSYDNYSHPDYLDNVAGKTITMPNGEVRTYSSDGTSYSIPAESWMGIGDSSYKITTHNQLSGMPYGEPSKQYIGLSWDQSEPAVMAAATGQPSWAVLGYGLKYGGSILDWMGFFDEPKPENKDKIGFGMNYTPLGVKNLPMSN